MHERSSANLRSSSGWPPKPGCPTRWQGWRRRVTGKLVPVFTGEELTRLEQACAGRSFAQRRDTAIMAVPRARLQGLITGRVAPLVCIQTASRVPVDAAEGVAEWAARDFACVVPRAWIDPGHPHDQPVSRLLPVCWAVTFPDGPGVAWGSVVKAALTGARPQEAADAAGRRFRLASPETALVLGGLALALMIADVPLSGLAHQSLAFTGGSVPVWISGPFAVAGFVVAWRKPGNPLGWIILATGVFLALSEDASYYAVADYRLRHGELPLGWLALLTQPAWAPGIVLFGLAILLFPDGRPPSPRLRPMVWVYAVVAVGWIAAAVAITAGAITGHQTQVDPGGNLLLLDESVQSPSWWVVLSNVFLALGVACWLVSLAAQALSYRRSAGERRQQLKWLMAGSAIRCDGGCNGW